MERKLIIPEQLIDITGEQNVEGGADQDRGNDDDEGVEITKMIDEVFEDETDKD